VTKEKEEKKGKKGITSLERTLQEQQLAKLVTN